MVFSKGTTLSRFLDGKLLAFDVDGTILNSLGQISSRTVRALEAADEAGASIVLATGRDWHGVKRLLKEVPSISYCICVNGVEVRARNGEIRFSQEIDRDLAKRVIQKVRDDIPETAFGASVDGLFVGEEIVCGFLPATDGETGTYPVRVVDDLSAELQNNVQDIVIFHKKYADDVGELYRQVLSVTSEYHDEVSIAFSGLPMLEVLPSGSGKHTGLSWLANSMSISQSEVIAFGDNLNDLTMLEWAGLGVAMGNGAPELFHYADQVTLTNDEDGVAAWIEKQLLE